MLHQILDSFKTSSKIYIELPLSVDSPFYIGFTRSTHRLLLKLSEVSGQLPGSLFISELTCEETYAGRGGGFADVFTGMMGQRKVAIKRLRTHIIPKSHDPGKLVQILLREVLIWRQLSHRFILPCFGVNCELFGSSASASQSLCIVSPWMDHGTLSDYVSEGGLTAGGLKLRRVADGLKYLHDENIIHGDLCARNVLIDNKLRPQITDFGLAVFDYATKGAFTTQHSGGSVRWMAPELHDYHLNTYRRCCETDVFAYGCTCYEVSPSCPPLYLE
ncbi:hypothetical protein JAAARDRAFT_139971 [Jaapia argillacea MUCL 33604]|uniref:Protein kinase domain-containing protein n=1 Tax=Jaapia argillacea MUCL 33604 TaxID=933084 RepID=A0A067PA18_9AGAM|nr:hypothetical protein JAAARDRAFT_139971 [Jaapia argillacea MUCL 33604]